VTETANCNFAVLDCEALLHVRGPDAEKFLQGQLTCDLRELEKGLAINGAYCTPQGRMVCDFMLFRQGGEHISLRMRATIIEQTAAVLGKYIIFSKAQLEQQSGGSNIIACWGPGAATLVGQLCGAVPAGQMHTIHAEGITATQLDNDGEMFECVLAAPAAEQHAQAIRAAATATPESAWQQLQIERGLARIEAANVDQFIPQMLNYDITGHVNFKKGCYTGQEVVARMHYRGKPKRRTYLLSGPADLQLSAGTALFKTDSTQSVGNIVNAVESADGVKLLAVATADVLDKPLHVGTPDGPALTLHELPYSLATD
jgi:tRNA-modifying protein YgfZ